MDLSRVQALLRPDLYQHVQDSSLPKIATMTLLQVWEAGSGAKLSALVEDGTLLTRLKRQHRQTLVAAQEVRLSGQNLTPVECLQVVELPLTLFWSRPSVSWQTRMRLQTIARKALVHPQQLIPAAGVGR